MTAAIDIKNLNSDDVFKQRMPNRMSFLALNGWENAKIDNLKQDGSFRRYYRIYDGEKTAILMDSVPELETIWTSSHRLKDFIALTKPILRAGLSVPEIYASDIEGGFCLMEDLGTQSYHKCLKEGQSEEELYNLAMEVLKTFRDNEELQNLELGSFFDAGLFTSRDQICTWYLPAVTGQETSNKVLESYHAAWKEIDKTLPEISLTFQHGDFHVDNLTYLPERSGKAKCGIFDYQGAVMGPLPYDLLNLLEDARRDVPENLKAELKASYMRELKPQDQDAFEPWYIAMSTMFHCRVIGYFMQVYIRDNKNQYQKHIPRLQNYISTSLEYDFMSPLKKWFDNQGDILEGGAPQIDPDVILPLIKE